MGITIIQKSDLSKPKTDTKIALVLAGGAISGAAFKLGGLQALDDFMINRRITDFDIYVGTSAGAILSVFLANGIPISEIIKSLEGKWGMLDTIRASELYYFNYREFISRPLRMISDIYTSAFRWIYNFISTNNVFRAQFRELVIQAIRHPTYKNIEALFKYVMMIHDTYEKKPSIPWSYIPTGVFTTDKFESSTRRNLENNNLYNDFNRLYDNTGKALYIVTTNLDNAERVVFGHDSVNTVPISKAMQASIAIPFFYKPVTIDNVDYMDGAVAKTTSMDWAIDKGAELVICYNPIRPFNYDMFCKTCEGQKGRIRITEDGIFAVFNQVMRTVLYTRMMNGLELRRKNPDFKGDIILVEPTEYDAQFFDMNPMAFWERRKAAKRGFESVRDSISYKYDMLKKILNAYGIDINPNFLKLEQKFDELAN